MCVCVCVCDVRIDKWDESGVLTLHIPRSNTERGATRPCPRSIPVEFLIARFCAGVVQPELSSIIHCETGTRSLRSMGMG